MLMIRVRPEIGESFRGWVARLAFENGYPNGDWLCRHRMRRRLDGINLDLARRLINGGSGELHCLEGVLPEATSVRHQLRIAGVTLPRSLMRLPLRQVCPACLEKHGWARGAWESVTAGCCREHDARLVSVCPGCQKQLNWTTMGLFRCSCGTDLRNIGAIPTSAALREADALLAGEGMKVVGCHSAAWSGLPVEDRADLIWMLGAVTGGEGGSKKRVMDHDLATRLMEAAGQALLDWPGRVIAGLDMLDRRGASLRRSLGPSYKWLMADRRTPLLEPLRAVVIEYARDHRSTPVHHKALQALGLPSGCPGAVTVGQASRRMGISPGSMSTLVASGRIRATTAEAGRRSLTKIESAEVDRYRGQRQTAYGREQVMALLGISRRRFKELCDEDLLPVMEGGKVTTHAIWRLDRKGVDALRQVLQELGPELSAVPTGRIALGEAMRSRLESGELAAILGAIIRNELRVLGRIEAASMLGALVVEESELVTFLGRHREAKSKTISIVEAALRLAIKQEVAYHLVSRGLLPPIAGHKERRMNRRIALASVEDFKERYIWLRDLAGAGGTSPRRAKGLLDARGIRPITAPDIDGCRQILYAKADVEGWIADQRWGASPPRTNVKDKS